MDTLTHERARLIQQRQEAEQRERARLAAEQQAQREIAEIDDQLRVLEQRQAEARFQAAVEQNAKLVTINAQAIQLLVTQLDSLVKRVRADLRDTGSSVNESFEDQQAVALTAIQEYRQRTAAPFPFAGRDLNSLTYEEARQLEQLENTERARFRQLETQFPNAVPVWAALQQWVHESPDPDTRRWRQAIGYGITGKIPNPGTAFNLINAVNEAAQLFRRHGRK